MSPPSREERLAEKKAKHAALLDHFGWLSFGALGELTPRQVDEYLLHARNEDSSIRRPEREPPAPSTAEQHVAAYLTQVRSSRRHDPKSFPPEAVAATVAAIRASYEKKGADDAGQRP